MASDMLLSLFPLQLVLFPGAGLPLHIFEPRYREMVGEAIERQSEFGVILAEGGKVCSVGCTAVVEEVTERFDDGRFNVATRGQRRFRALELNRDKEYPRAGVEFIQDLDDEPADESLLMRAQELVAELVMELDIEAFMDVAGDERQASFAMAAPLPLDAAFKQQLLELRSEKERMIALTEHLRTVLRRNKMTERMRKLAGTNGHTRRDVE
ncbi:MAG: LON peptidase substrate-binding domain-containing protein [Acidobacteria bacterium]|nr:LON peptidase substrate-binding domain-containing protein [Acidobacteriota bacterium]